MRMNVLAETSRHQRVAPVDMRALSLPLQPLQVPSGQLQDRKANAVEARSIRSHVSRKRQVCATSLGEHATCSLSALWREQNFDLLNDCWSKRCHAQRSTSPRWKVRHRV